MGGGTTSVGEVVGGGEGVGGWGTGRGRGRGNEQGGEDAARAWSRGAAAVQGMGMRCAAA